MMLKKQLLAIATLLLATLAGGDSVANEESGYLPVQIVNNSQIAENKEVYVTIKASKPNSKNDCFVRFKDKKPKGVCIDVKKDTDTSQYSYKLSELKDVLYLPKLISGRIYLSLGYPMEFSINYDSENNAYKIVEPDGFNPRDPNYYTLYDKVEFTYTEFPKTDPPIDGTWANPTAVDFFSLPLRVEQKHKTAAVTEAGFAESRAEIFARVKSTFKEYDKSPNKIWSRLWLKYKNDDGNKTILRLMSPGKAMITSPTQKTFDPQYLTNNDSENSFNYIKFIWDYYKDKPLKIDVSELLHLYPLDDYLFSGKVINNKFVFTNASNTFEVVLDRPVDSTPFFAGATGVFDAVNNTPKAVIVRALTSAFEVGLLPTDKDVVLSNKYFSQSKAKGKFFLDNPLLPDRAVGKGPWYDLYSQALHSIGENQPIYTFAYDDALGQDGTLHDSRPRGENPALLTITLGDMSGTFIPNPYYDETLYTINPQIGANSKVVYIYKVLIDDKKIEKRQELETDNQINNVGIPFEVIVNGHKAKIYIKTPMVKPRFEGADGIVITPQAGTQHADIIFPGRPKP